MQKAALYIRVSTDKQEELSPNAQKRLLMEYANKNNMIIPEEYIFVENGISGKKAIKRPKFQQMISIAKSKEHPFDVILVWKFSRFARNQEESIVYKSLLNKNKVEVISISEPLSDDPFGSLIERIIEWMDEYYSIRLSGEVMRGMTEKALRGGYQSSPPLGYKIIHSGELPVIIPEEADIIRTIFHKYVYEKLTFYQIARYLNYLNLKTKKNNNFDRRSIEYIIQNPIYKGYIRWNRTHNADNEIKNSSDWIIKKGKHEPIIQEELFELAQERCMNDYSLKKKRRPVTEYKHWLSGVIKCSNCGSTLTVSRTNKSSFLHFSCNAYSKGKCPVCNSISENKLIPAITNTLIHVIINNEIYYRKNDCIINYDITNLQQQLERLKDKELRIKSAYYNGIDTLEEYKNNKDSIKQQRLEFIKEITRLKVQENSSNQADEIIYIQNINSIIANSQVDNIVKNKAITSIIKKIVFNKAESQVDIFFTL